MRSIGAPARARSNDQLARTLITERDHRVELRQLQYFVTLAEELHFGRAAQRLHIVQPAVSQQLRGLETELGTRLVDRSTRRVALTAAGQRFLPEAGAVLAAAERARDAVAGHATLRLGTSTGL